MREIPREWKGPGSTPRKKRGGAHRHGPWRKDGHTMRGAETKGGGWQVVGVGDVQAEGALCQYRRWVAGARERGYK